MGSSLHCELTENIKRKMRAHLLVVFLVIAVFALSVTGQNPQPKKSIKKGSGQRVLGRSSAGAKKTGGNGAKTAGRSVKQKSHKTGRTSGGAKQLKKGKAVSSQSRKGTQKFAKTGTRKSVAKPKGARSGAGPQARACDETCINDAVSYMKMMRGKVATLKKQMALIDRHSGTAEKKGPRKEYSRKYTQGSLKMLEET